jgi:SAM-dependent methyltransferase
MGSKFKGIPLKIDPGKYLSQLYEGINYKEFWEENSKSELDTLEHTLLQNLLPSSGTRIIDVGCGFGRLADCYLDRFEQVVMLDGSMTLLRQAQDLIKDKAIYIAADANHLPFRRASFDCVLMMRVFHHLGDSQLILNELHRVLGDLGVLVFNYCNKRSARQFVRWFFRMKKENPFTLEPVGVGTPFISHHPDYVHDILNKTGYSEISYFGTGVMDKFSGRLGRLEKWLPSGEALAPFLGALKLAPWINCRAIAHGEELNQNKNMEELLVCPLCHNALQKSLSAYICVSCGKSYPIKDGIADFRYS